MPPRWLDWQRRRHLSRDDYAEYQFASARGRLRALADRFGFPAPRVLDVGCGLGGMSTAYSLDGASVVAIDEAQYDGESLHFARRFAKTKGAAVTFLPVAGPEWPLADAVFDLVFLDSVLEHAAHPEALLTQSLRVLRPGGWMLISFPIYYGPFGGHIDDYIRIPWFHLLPRVIVLRTLRDRHSLGAYVTPDLVERILLSLNRLTLRRFRALIRELPVEVAELSRSAYLTTPGNQLMHDLRDALRSRDLPAAVRAVRRIPSDFDRTDIGLFILLSLLLPLGRVPLLQEVVLGGVRATLRKRSLGIPRP